MKKFLTTCCLLAACLQTVAVAQDNTGAQTGPQSVDLKALDKAPILARIFIDTPAAIG